jgi:cytochrome P450
MQTPPEAAVQFDIGSTDDSLERMVELFALHGDIYRVYVPARKAYTYVIHHPDDVKRVLVTNHRNYTKGVGLDRIKILLGNGIIGSEGQVWTRQRYMMQPCFHRRVVAEFVQTICVANNRLLERWDGLARRGEPVNVTEEVSELTLDIVLRAIFGSDVERMSAEFGSNPFAVLVRETARDLRFAYKFRSLTKIVAALIERRHEENEEHFDYLSMLMSARDRDTGRGMSDRELIDEIMTLMVAGHETTASGLNWTWYLLSQDARVEARLSAETEAAAIEAGSSLADLERLVYARQVIDESLRLYPPVWLLSRRTIGPDVLSEYELPPGTNILLPLYLLHRHPRYWKDPATFRPERFASEYESEQPRFCYMPFAAGPRHCIGETFALFEMLIHLHLVARRFRLIYLKDRPPELEALINLRTRHSLYMRLERRGC